MPPSGCYAITTRKFNLIHDHREWFVNTQMLYNKVVGFYYGLYVELWGENGNEMVDDGLTGADAHQETGVHTGTGPQMDAANERLGIQGRQDAAGSRFPSNREAMGILEKLTIPGRDGRAPERSLPFERVPLYFRRAAINAAIAAVKSELAREGSRCIRQSADMPAKSGTENGKESISAGNSQKHGVAIPAGIPEFHQPVTYYKGMYTDLTDRSVTLKVWNGEKWMWTACKLSGNHIPEGAQVMSPSVAIKEKSLELHVPVKEQVTDGRNAKERMAVGDKICAAVFTNEDACVVCCVMEGQKPAGEMQETSGAMDSSSPDGLSEPRDSSADTLAEDTERTRTASGPALFIRGGKGYAHKCRQVVEKLEKSKSSTEDDNNAKANQKYWMRLKHLNDSYSHLFSRKVIDYCVDQGAKVLVLPEYKKPYTNMLMVKAGDFSPLHLSYQIREKLKYKAWKAGIVVLEAGQYHTGDACAICGMRAKRCGKHRSEYVCENGHKGNYYLNMARNLGVRCMESFNVRRERLPEKQRTEENDLT